MEHNTPQLIAKQCLIILVILAVGVLLCLWAPTYAVGMNVTDLLFILALPIWLHFFVAACVILCEKIKTQSLQRTFKDIP